MTVQQDKSALLDSLKIERTPIRRGTSPWIWVALVVLLLAGAGAGWYFWPDNRIAVHVVTASAEGAGGATGSGLDASGYVVARRKATLATKILGKLTEVNFEEGDAVKAGDVVARLDDSNYRASLMEAEARARQAKMMMDNTAPIYARYQKLKGEGAISTDAVENQRLAYDNARLPEALLLAGERVGDSAMIDDALTAMACIDAVQTAPDGHFRAVGTEGFGTRYEPPLPFDQQPLEAWATVDAMATALRLTGDRRWAKAAERAYRWYLGDNDLGMPMATPDDGGCFDGLMSDRANLNQGAESVLAFQLACVTMAQLAEIQEHHSGNQRQGDAVAT